MSLLDDVIKATGTNPKIWTRIAEDRWYHAEVKLGNVGVRLSLFANPGHDIVELHYWDPAPDVVNGETIGWRWKASLIPERDDNGQDSFAHFHCLIHQITYLEHQFETHIVRRKKL